MSTTLVLKEALIPNNSLILVQSVKNTGDGRWTTLARLDWIDPVFQIWIMNYRRSRALHCSCKADCMLITVTLSVLLFVGGAIDLPMQVVLAVWFIVFWYTISCLEVVTGRLLIPTGWEIDDLDTISHVGDRFHLNLLRLTDRSCIHLERISHSLDSSYTSMRLGNYSMYIL